ncbi:MAG: DUF2336 domain-containing protein [Proteobacteria bacterium]|nr:DUF2336 domain-containing protein [Pseudomonadota bacterium]
MSTDDPKYLLNLARDRSEEGRRALVDAISDLFSDETSTITERERQLMYQILHQLVVATERWVRAAVSARIADLPDAPSELIKLLANDEINVAFPILTQSDVLRDIDLIEIVRHRAVEHQLAISIRQSLSEDLSAALVESGNENVIVNLLNNSGAKISFSTLEYLVDESKRVNSFQEPILRREDLPQDIAKRMYVWVSAALRQHIVENFDVDPQALDDLVEKVAADGADVGGDAKPNSKSEQLAADLEEEDMVTPELLIDALKGGHIHLFVSLLRRLTNLRQTLITRLILEPSGDGMAITCKALRFSRDHYAEIYDLCGRARRDAKVRAIDQTAALEFFDDISEEASKKVLQHWARNVDYLTAIRRMER